MGTSDCRWSDGGLRRGEVTDMAGSLDICRRTGQRLKEQGRWVEVIEHYNRAIQQWPSEMPLYNELACALYEAGHAEAAAEVWEIMLQLQPDITEAHNNLGVMLKGLGRLGEAEVHLRRAITLRPDYADAYVNLGNVMKLGGDSRTAVECYGKALKLKPREATIYCNLGNALVAEGHLQDGEDAYKTALELEPKLAVAHWNWALLQLRQGDFERGWAEYEWGFSAGERPLREFRAPRWQGEALAGRRLLVWAEQGFGDSLQFVRYLAPLRNCGAEVVFECRRELVGLLHESGLADRVIEEGMSEDMEFDWHIPLLSVPMAIQARVATIPGASGYLHAEPRLAAMWRGRLGRTEGLRVGLAWSCNPGLAVHGNRSCPVEQLLEAVGNIAGVTLCNLQMGVGSDTVVGGMIDLTGEIRDFADTAALIESLDLVITVDTAIAHVAGALGKPVWTLLPKPADWRWMTGSVATPWYQSMVLVRQCRAGEWDTVLDRVRGMLIELVAGRIRDCAHP